jgi:hypothetical protein
MQSLSSSLPAVLLEYYRNQPTVVQQVLGRLKVFSSLSFPNWDKQKESPKLPKIKSNQYWPNGFGSPCSTYYYIVDEIGRIFHHDKKWRIKPLNDLTKYYFKSLSSAEDKLKELPKPDRVYFYVEFGQVIAVFPDRPYKSGFDDRFIAYRNHTNNPKYGYHAVMSLEDLRDCKLASKEEYKALEGELLSLGYKLEILNWF